MSRDSPSFRPLRRRTATASSEPRSQRPWWCRALASIAFVGEAASPLLDQHQHNSKGENDDLHNRNLVAAVLWSSTLRRIRHMMTRFRKVVIRT
jgi:hypothetical protein